MDVFFQFVSVFALFFGIAGLVYGTEVSRRCQLMIDKRITEIEDNLKDQTSKQNSQIQGALTSLKRTARALEDTEMAQTREINAIRRSVEPLVEAYEKAAEQKAKDDQRKPAVQRH